jgi:PAS domain S-box-containing protein
VCEQTTDFVIVTGVDGHIIYSNASAQRVFGFDPAVTPPELEQRYAPSSRPRLAELLVAAAEHGTARGELSMLAADGSEIPVSQVTLVQRTRDGGVECYSTIARDISREKSTERQLLLRGAKLRSLVEQAADLVIVLDERGIVTATKRIDIEVPIVIRLTGTNEAKALEILKEAGFSAYTSMDDVVQEGVRLAAAAGRSA